MENRDKIKLLIIDSSALVRNILKEDISQSKEIDVVGIAADANFAAEKINKYNPDVIVMDINILDMDGFSNLSNIIVSDLKPVVVLSSYPNMYTNKEFQAFKLGLVDFIIKPDLGRERSYWSDFSKELIKVIIDNNNLLRYIKKYKSDNDKKIKDNKDNKDNVSVNIYFNKAVKIRNVKTSTVIAIGASTGGTRVISEILTRLSEDIPGIIIAVHMPERFTKDFADGINNKSRLYVKEAEHGDRLYKGMALIAPGNKHLLLKHDTDGYMVEINNDDPVNRFRPSVDVLFKSVAESAKKNSIGILLTGMGSDGAEGLNEMKLAGAITIAQDEASSAVFGMPRVAISKGAALMVKNVEAIIEYLTKLNS